MISADGWSAREDRIEQIRELHKPVGGAWVVECVGCDFDGYPTEAGPPLWPCRTARLLYSQDEIAAVFYARPEE